MVTRSKRKYFYNTGNWLWLVPNEPRFWNFIGELRADEKVQHGFVEQLSGFDEEKQRAYMENYADCYWVAVETYGFDDYYKTNNRIIPWGFVGVVDNDLRICVDPLAQGNGIGKFMLEELKVLIDIKKVDVKVKHDNIPSHKLFLSCGFTEVCEDSDFKHYKFL